MIFYYRSQCYHELGDSNKAIEEITKCTEMGNDRDYYALAERSDFYRESGRYDEAINDSSKMIEILPTDADAYFGAMSLKVMIKQLWKTTMPVLM